MNKDKRELRIETCEFKRVGSANWEQGVIVNEGNGPIIDLDGKVVQGAIYNWRERSAHVMTVIED